MCGRFVGYKSIAQLQHYFPIDVVRCGASPNFNVAPTQEIPVIYRHGGANVLGPFHWGLVPHWAKDTVIGNRMINARMETVATKPSFREAFKKRRCLIPADGFFEWQGTRGHKQPFFITLPNPPRSFAFAGLWDIWRDDYRSCAIITRPAGDCLRHIHGRMPAVLHPDAYDAWLDTDAQATNAAMEILTAKTITDFVFWPVSKEVNATRTNVPSNIDAISLPRVCHS